MLCPTRELALQVSRELEQIGQFRGTKVVAIYGGAPMTRQVDALEAGRADRRRHPGPRARPPPPADARTRRASASSSSTRPTRCSRWASRASSTPSSRSCPRTGRASSSARPSRRTSSASPTLTCATPEIVTLSSDQVGALEITHYVYVVQSGDKIGQLVRILEVEDPESAIIFCNTRDETQRVAEALKNRGFDADWLNGDLPQTDRERVMSATREGRLRFLVATDVAARGIDISHLTHVINYDFPETAEQYVHRTGRTGRAGRTGTAIALVGPKDIGNLYLLRLTYKIRPIEKQLPSAGELKTRAEMDLLQALRRGVREPAVRTRTICPSRGGCSRTTKPSASWRACCAITWARAGATSRPRPPRRGVANPRHTPTPHVAPSRLRTLDPPRARGADAPPQPRRGSRSEERLRAQPARRVPPQQPAPGRHALEPGAAARSRRGTAPTRPAAVARARPTSARSDRAPGARAGAGLPGIVRQHRKARGRADRRPAEDAHGQGHRRDDTAASASATG